LFWDLSTYYRVLALGVPTKIARGTIEIVNEVHLVVKDSKVGASEATLLNMLNISPFTYGMVVQQVYDSGNVFPPSILDIEESSLLAYFTAAIQNVASVSLAANYPTIVSIKHSLVNAYKNLLAVSVETEYDFEGSEKVFPLSLLFACLGSPMMILNNLRLSGV
jgi:large subunit ribosomal protein LP0